MLGWGVGGVEGWVDKVQQLKIISLLFVRRSLSFWITGGKKEEPRLEEKRGEDAGCERARSSGRQNGLSPVPSAGRNNGPPLRDINHKPLSPDVCLYVLKSSAP